MITGAPPAEYGGKTSLVIVVTTRSGQGVTTPTGNITASYGTFGSASGGVDLGLWRKELGKFLRVGRAEYRALSRSAGVYGLPRQGQRAECLRSRSTTSFRRRIRCDLNLNYSRSWFQTPNAYDNLNVANVVAGGTSANPVFVNVGNTDQKSKIETFNISPTYTHVISD